ncbi:MAG: serine/threonine-protein phosphatase [Lachnospiraceae bacterium oral taxon 082]|nr:serine/threonine-protein phosphatase [Lachnospiraceae bacterium oral taxon 082]
MISSYGFSEIGNSKKNINQDAIFYNDNGVTGIFVVSDGVGGMKSGEVASSKVCEKIETAWSTVNSNEISDIKEIVSVIKENLTECHEEILSEYGNECGATVVVLVISIGQCAVIWAGDSRCYMMNGKSGIFTALTKDDVENEKDSKITNAIGFFSTPMFNTTYLDYEGKASFLLMSDGIYKYVDKESISDAARLSFVYGKVQKACENLKNEAYKNGAGDNLSLIAVAALV